MTPLFKSVALQNEFDQNGFVRLPFLSKQQVEELLQQYKTLEEEHRQIGLPFITTSHSNNHELIRKADIMIGHYFLPIMNDLLIGCEKLFGNFLIKQPDADSVTPVHQDTVFVDEEKYASITVWVSLHDTTPENGCMRFIKGSHKFIYAQRPAHQYPWAFENVKEELERRLTDYPTKKGEAIIFHHGVIHASYANLTNKPRVAAIMAAYPKGAELWMQYQSISKPKIMQTYSMDSEAFLHFIKGSPPHLGRLIKEEPVNFRQVTSSELHKFFQQNEKETNRLSNFLRHPISSFQKHLHGLGF